MRLYVEGEKNGDGWRDARDKEGHQQVYLCICLFVNSLDHVSLFPVRLTLCDCILWEAPQQVVKLHMLTLSPGSCFQAFQSLAVKAGMKPGDEARKRELPHTRTREQSHSQSSVPPHMGAWE